MLHNWKALVGKATIQESIMKSIIARSVTPNSGATDGNLKAMEAGLNIPSFQTPPVVKMEASIIPAESASRKYMSQFRRQGSTIGAVGHSSKRLLEATMVNCSVDALSAKKLRQNPAIKKFT